MDEKNIDLELEKMLSLRNQIRLENVQKIEEQDLIALDNKIDINTYRDTLKNAILLITSESESVTKDDLLHAFDQVERICQITDNIPAPFIEKCWEFVSCDDEDLHTAAVLCLTAIFKNPCKAETMYGSDLPMMISKILERETINEYDRNLIYKLIFASGETRSMCITDEFAEFILQKATDSCDDHETLACLIDIILECIDISPVIKSNLALFLSNIEGSFTANENHLYMSMLILIYRLVSDATSEEWLCSFCQAQIFSTALSTLSLSNTKASKLIIGIIHAMVGKKNSISSLRVIKSIVNTNVFSVLQNIITENDQSLIHYAYDMLSSLCSQLREVKDMIMGSPIPNILLETYEDMPTYCKKKALKLLANLSRYAVEDKIVCEFVFRNNLLMLFAEVLDVDSVLSIAIFGIRSIIAAGMKLIGTENYDMFLEQIFDDNFVEYLEDKIDDMENSDDDDETYDLSREKNQNDLYDIISIINTLKNQ